MKFDARSIHSYPGRAAKPREGQGGEEEGKKMEVTVAGCDWPSPVAALGALGSHHVLVSEGLREGLRSCMETLSFILKDVLLRRHS